MTTPKKKIPLPPFIHIGNVNPSECGCIENVNIKELKKTLKKNENGEFVLTKHDITSLKRHIQGECDKGCRVSGKKVVAVLDSYMQRKPLPSLKNSLIDNEK
jgi:hypothetical protein